MAENPKSAPLGGLARKLIQAGLLKEEQAIKATENANKQHLPFVSFLVAQRLIDGTALALFCCKEFGLPLFDISTLNTDLVPKSLLKADFIISHHALPIFKRGNRLFVAVSDPTNVKALDE